MSIPKESFFSKNRKATKEDEKLEEVDASTDSADSRVDAFLAGVIPMPMILKGRVDIVKPVILLSIALVEVYAGLRARV